MSHKVPDQKWDDIFNGLTIFTPDGFSALLEKCRSNRTKDAFQWDKRSLLKEAINRIEEKSFWDFIDVLLLSDDIDHYDSQDFLSSLPQTWKNRVSYKDKLPSLIYRFGERYSHQYTNVYAFNSFVKEISNNKVLIEKFVSGIVAGLASGNEFADENSFFGFVRLAAPYINNQDAVNLVGYSLSRFELHIEEDFGDGAWREDLQCPDNINKNIAGFIWSALGSPRSEMRWNASHCVRKLVEYNCTNLIDSLVYWLKHDKVDAFGHHKFPFYNLHARQYLLIAFARGSIEKPGILLTYSELFLHFAISQHHALIQKFAVETALNIESSFPGTYKPDTVTLIGNVGKSKSSIKEEDYPYSAESYWPEENKIEIETNYHFDWDFDKYWYDPLGDVFGLSSKQIQDFAGNLIVKEWGMGDKNGYNKDPRVILWNRSSQERETWHNHGSYPRTDRLDFYLSYHSMLVIAARLVEKMPEVKTDDWSDDPWSDWLLRHSLTRQDGKWLADCRDALPLNRPSWILEEKKDSWRTDIIEDDFLNWLQENENGELWINVKGHWEENDKERTETVSISTALVSPKTSNSLLRALSTSSDPYDVLPYFNERNVELESGIFQLKGWINDRSISNRLDEFDPYADGIEYPPYSLGNTIIERLALATDGNGKIWQMGDTPENILICQTWSSHRARRDEEPNQSGIRLRAKLPFLKQLCERLGFELIFDVSIKRDISHKYSSSQSEYYEPQHKIFILSADGKLRTSNTNYQLG